ncbi:MAG: hypothetical protein WCV91_00805, partial [Candidatus Margulisiibacteriota bacterium]
MVLPVPGGVQGPYFPVRPTWAPSGQTEEYVSASSGQGTVPITVPPLAVVAPLSREEEILFVEQVIGLAPGSNIDQTKLLTMIVIANGIYNNSTSTTLSKEAREQLLSNPVVVGLLRMLFLRVANNTELKPVKLAAPVESPTLREDFAAFSAARSARPELQLPDKVLDLFRRGKYTIEVSYTTRQSETTGYIVVLKSGTNVEATIEYKDGKLIPSKDDPILARATIAYLQYSLVMAGALGLGSGWKEGVFCKSTLDALRTFLSSQNIAGLPNLKDSLSLLRSKQREAEKAIGEYKAVAGTNDESLYKRLRAAERALDAISVALETAKRYRSAVPQGAPAEYLELLALSNKLIESLSLEAKGILQVVLGSNENKWKGLLVRVDVRSLNAMRKRLLEVYKEKGKGKAWHTIGYVDNLIGFVMKLRRWKELSATLNMRTEYVFMSSLAAKGETRAREYLKEIPGESLYVAERMQVLGEPMERANISIEEASDARRLVSRSQNAHVISERIGRDPSREVLLGFIRQSLRGKKPKEVAGILKAFSLIAGDGNLSALAMSSFVLQVREDLLGIISNPEVKREGGDPSDAESSGQEAIMSVTVGDNGEENERLTSQL